MESISQLEEDYNKATIPAQKVYRDRLDSAVETYWESVLPLQEACDKAAAAIQEIYLKVRSQADEDMERVKVQAREKLTEE